MPRSKRRCTMPRIPRVKAPVRKTKTEEPRLSGVTVKRRGQKQPATVEPVAVGAFGAWVNKLGKAVSFLQRKKV